ncbi:phage portal protein family protein [Actinoplanes sp. CA-051413]|uniref:phage portal protein family protein n=1 Tax=Actinoplanes sp. CA-051413 TaxID=3239899 RepID=UPI003D97EF95
MSVPIYAKMRRDPKLSSILQGWNLNLRRAQWQLDPAGCRPEVVQQVADGMGLAVKGNDEPGAARLRGVSWGDHLSAALRMVAFGFSAFEMEADTSSGQARLSGLWERPQWTISHIHVDGKTGLLNGATQDQAAKAGAPQMLAKNMVWYAREREGSNWAGASLLRPSYASWLIKEEVRRAYAVANVRWSAGVPVMEALPGTNPTSAQMAEAAQMAQAARAGVTAGGSTPPGFTMKILGITGSLPNSQEFLRWLDQQCASSALMNAFDLGETPNGSRALGTVFMDALLLALESEAELVADVATRQIAARIVDWNHGEDEPVPRVVVSGVGSRREVTAESLNLLLSSGALAAEPGLEAWVRREYRLPEREESAQPVVVPGVDLDEQGRPAKPPSGPADPADLPAEVAARQADLDWGLFGGTQAPEPGQLDLFDDSDDVDLSLFAP